MSIIHVPTEVAVGENCHDDAVAAREHLHKSVPTPTDWIAGIRVPALQAHGVAHLFAPSIVTVPFKVAVYGHTVKNPLKRKTTVHGRGAVTSMEQTQMTAITHMYQFVAPCDPDRPIGIAAQGDVHAG